MMQEAGLISTAVVVTVAGAVPVGVETSTNVTVLWLEYVPVAGAVAMAVRVVVPPGGGDVVCVEPPSEPGGVARAPPQPEVAKVSDTKRSGRARTAA